MPMSPNVRPVSPPMFPGIPPAIHGWVDPRRQSILGLASGLLMGDTPAQGLGLGFQYASQGKQADDAFSASQKAEAERQAEINQTAQWAMKTFPQLQGAPPGIIADIAPKLFQEQLTAGPNAPPASVQEYEYAKSNGYEGSFADWMQTGKNGAAGPQLGLQPQWGIGPDGKPVLGQMSSDGRFVPTQMPHGVTPMDPGALAGNKAGAVVDAKTQAAAQAALPGAEQALAITRDAIDALRNDTKGMSEQFGNVLGIPQQMLPTIPGTPRANFQVQLEQATGQAFMQARAMLKGGGQITDYEGRRGEAAYARMQAAAEKGDQQAFLSALDDFEKAVEDGYKKLQEVAGGTYQPSLQPNTGPSGTTSSGVQWSIGDM